jgi:transcription elongation GreA/GreB family factor
VGAADLARSSSIIAAEIFSVKVFIGSAVTLVVMVEEEVAELRLLGGGEILAASELLPGRNTQRRPSL